MTGRWGGCCCCQARLGFDLGEAGVVLARPGDAARLLNHNSSNHNVGPAHCRPERGEASTAGAGSEEGQTQAAIG